MLQLEASLKKCNTLLLAEGVPVFQLVFQKLVLVSVCGAKHSLSLKGQGPTIGRWYTILWCTLLLHDSDIITKSEVFPSNSVPWDLEHCYPSCVRLRSLQTLLCKGAFCSVSCDIDFRIYRKEFYTNKTMKMKREGSFYLTISLLLRLCAKLHLSELEDSDDVRCSVPFLLILFFQALCKHVFLCRFRIGKQCRCLYVVRCERELTSQPAHAKSTMLHVHL